MARISPFRAITYSRTAADISTLAAPPYDVISPEQREALLARDPHNVVALELADGPLDPAAPGSRYDNARMLWNEWREEGVLVEDDEPALYLLEQRFEISGKPVRRRAVIAAVELHAFDEGVILPHERTLPKALGDRFNLLRATAANMSQVYGLLRDRQGVIDKAFDFVAEQPPTMTATDDAGVESIVWRLTDARRISHLTEALSSETIFIADGHHRYTVALAYRDERRTAAVASGTQADTPAYDSVMMALTNMDDPELVVLPTHRVATAADAFDAESFYAALERHFELSDPLRKHPSAVLEGIDRPAFLVMTRADDRPRIATLRAEVDLDSAIPVDHSHAWRELDVAVLQELVLDPILDIHPDRPETLERLAFVKDAHDALSMTATHDVAFVVRPTRMDQMRAVAMAGDVMPQKSTFFYPKLLSGLVFRDVS